MKIEITIERPVSLLVLTALTVGGVVWYQTWEGSPTQASAIETPQVQVEPVLDAHGGSDQVPEKIVFDQEQDSKRLRQEQELAERQEEILRYQIRAIEEQMTTFNVESNPTLRDEFHKSVKELIALLMDKKRGEKELMESLAQIQEAQGRVLATDFGPLRSPIKLSWPVDPVYGVSAHFDDPGYKEVFGFPHKAIDIPTEQGTTVVAPADGVVEEYVDNGTGYSWLTIRHKGYATLYGHITDALVKPGDTVFAGDPIAKSGGLPGSKGSGRMTTGPHLHFELITDDGHVDPEPYLPALPSTY